MATKKREVPINLIISLDDAYQAYEKGKNTGREPALLKRVNAAERAIKRVQEGPYDHRKERSSTAGQRREAARIFGRQEQTVETQGRLGRIPGAVVGPNERFKRVTEKEKQEAANLTGSGLEIASYAIGAGQMIGLITGAAKLLTGAAAKLFAKGGEKALSQTVIKKANAEARKAAKTKVAKTASKTTTKPKPTSKEENTKYLLKQVEAKKAANKAVAASASAQATAAKTAAKKAKAAATKKAKEDAAKKAKAAATKKANKAAKKAADKIKAADALVIPGAAVGTVASTLIAADLIDKDKTKKAKTKARSKKAQESPAAGSSPTVDIGRIKGEPLEKQYVEARKPIINVKLDESGSSLFGENVPKKQIKKVQAKINKNEGADGPYGTTAGRNAIQGFFEEAFGYTPTVDYSFPREGDRDTMKKGGKVTAKKKKKASYGKKYSMNRGGMASLRKPTRA